VVEAISIVLAVAVMMATLAAVVVGIIRLWQRRWASCAKLGGAAVVGAMLNLLVVPAAAALLKVFVLTGGHALQPREKARILAESISETMNYGAGGVLIGMPGGLVLLAAGLIGSLRARSPRDQKIPATTPDGDHVQVTGDGSDEAVPGLASDQPAAIGRDRRWQRLPRWPFFVLGVFASVALVYRALPKTGTLLVRVFGPGGVPAENVKVSVDGQERCARSPCQVRELVPGEHRIELSVPGYQQPSARTVQVERGGDTVVEVQVTPK
jgi:hypothetical protein